VFLDTLLDLNEAGANFSDEELRDEVVTMMIGVSVTKNSKVCRQFLNINDILITGQ
jgi:cytochrome P450 family 4